jgi:uncharacterized PurR-regulated membrane protein YhhQ (DUF165 family)
MTGYLALLGFSLTIPAANWLIGNVGTVCSPQGPCLVPVAPGLMAPSGVLMIGLALVLRDLVHARLGWRWALAAIAVGAALTGLVAPPALAVASVAAFTVSELADMAVYAPLARRRLMLAVAASGVAGAAIDSAVFLLLAFGSLDYLAGNVVGKLWMTALVVPVLWTMRRRSITA